MSNRFSAFMASFVHRSHAMRRLLAELDGLPREPRAALVRGEAGTGKRRLAKALRRRWGVGGELVIVECDLPHSHSEDLFSYRSRLNEVKVGTLLLSHVDQLAPKFQREVLNLRFRIGLGRRDGWALVATTTCDLEALVEADAFDHRLHELVEKTAFTMPPLRERRTDLVQLVRELLVSLYEDETDLPKSIASEALDAITAYHWPGNVTELCGALEHAMLAAGTRDRIELMDLPRKVRGTPELADAGANEWPTLAEAEQKLILATLQRFGGHHGSAAVALGIHPNTLGRKLKSYGFGRTRRPRTRVPSSRSRGA